MGTASWREAGLSPTPDVSRSYRGARDRRCRNRPAHRGGSRESRVHFISFKYVMIRQSWHGIDAARTHIRRDI
jgi:hypothetical protein